MQEGLRTEQKLKIQTFYVLLGLFLTLTSLPAPDWWHFKDSSYSLLAVSATSLDDYLSLTGKCVTTHVPNQGFLCAGETDDCAAMRRVRSSGKGLVVLLGLAVPLYMWVGVNVSRKLGRLRSIRLQRRSVFDSDLCMYLAPGEIVFSFLLWFYWLTSPSPSPWSQGLTLGISFQNAAIGATILLAGCVHYFCVVRKAFLDEITMRSVFY